MKTDETKETDATPEGYLTKKEIATRCRRTTRTIEVWMQRGYLPYIKLGPSVLFKWADLESHLADNLQFGVNCAGVFTRQRLKVRGVHEHQGGRERTASTQRRKTG